jgi:hypothetical protein
MSATLTPSTAADRAGKRRAKRSAPPNVTGPALKGLAIFVVLAAFGLGIALVAGATFVFNVVVWLLFTVLWVAFVGALAFSPATLDEVWQAARRPAILIQAVVWLLFLPIMAGLWIWQRPWAAAIRLMLLLAIAVWNVFLFFPRS